MRLIYLVPTFANASGRTVPLSQRRELVALIISDDIYDYLSYLLCRERRRRTVASTSLVGIDRALPALSTDPYAFGHTLSNGSFSKVIDPGVRTR